MAVSVVWTIIRLVMLPGACCPLCLDLGCVFFLCCRACFYSQVCFFCLVCVCLGVKLWCKLAIVRMCVPISRCVCWPVYVPAE